MSKLATVVLAIALLVVVACSENGGIAEPVESSQPGAGEKPSATPVPATGLPQSTEPPPKVTGLPTPTPTSSPPGPDAENLTGTATPGPAPLAPLSTAAPVDTTVPVVAPRVSPSPTATTPESTPTVIPTPPPYHYTSAAEADAGAIELGCSGWYPAVVGGVTYYRACASAEVFESLVSGSTAPRPDTGTTATPAPTATPPPYHYLTLAEAETAAIELGCTGFSKTVIDNNDYYRACAADDAFEVYALGAPTYLSGGRCDLASDATVRFSAAPTDLTQIASIVPAGSPSGGVIKPHSYFFNKDVPGTIKSVRLPVYAIADSVVSSVAFYNTGVGTNEYLIFFDVTCEISYKFDHLMELAPKLAAVAPDIPADDSRTTRTPPITLEAGELIGYSNGAGGDGGWDFGVYDTTFVNQFANQERYVKGRRDQLLHTVCPYDYFTEPLKSQMYALLGTHDRRLVPDVECTTTQRDVLGAAAGAWFDTQVFEFSDVVIAIAMMPGDIVAVTGIGDDLRIDRGQPTWLDPELLTSTHCYAGDGRWFFIKIQADGMQMAIADGTGGCPGSLPAGATVYYR